MGGKLPTINQPAPEFTLPTNTGDGKISLSDLRGKWLVLYFYPKDFTSGCTIEARRFQQDLPQYLEKNAQIIGVSADDIDSHAQFCDSEGLKFPLLADTDGSVSKAYGSWLAFIDAPQFYHRSSRCLARDFCQSQPHYSQFRSTSTIRKIAVNSFLVQNFLNS
ncbi:hypothetical protein ANSO36C_46810 [Nostoc cf. commune SO-36]|uniref:thioredoxin-dependent peroxiredoxin n=1 Tax=Nostoc cf. commune SO-36 TaxID=449208 RepID=A0ABM7Z6W8_NOSCO|nr:hypothetical protein ANSO36C_46810 [Nostoc cf. commune SO-36]